MKRPTTTPWLDKSKGLFLIGTLFLALGVIDGATNFEKYTTPSALDETGVALLLGGAISKKKVAPSDESEDPNDK